MLSNEKVINAFFDGKNASNTNLRSCNYCAGRLINYNTTLCQFWGGTVIFNATKYSSSTSRIQSMIRRNFGFKAVIEITNVPIGTFDLSPYVPKK